MRTTVNDIERIESTAYENQARVSFIDGNEIIQTLASNGPNESFSEARCPRGGAILARNWRDAVVRWRLGIPRERK